MTSLLMRATILTVFFGTIPLAQGQCELSTLYSYQVPSGIDFRVHHTNGIAVAPDGGIYFSEPELNCVRRLRLDGTVETVAGTGEWGYLGDGGPALSAMLARPQGVAFDNAGNLYIADMHLGFIRKVDSKGIITSVAGGGPIGTEEFIFRTPIEAMQIRLREPVLVTAGKPGEFLFLQDDPRSSRMWRVNAQGLVNQVPSRSANPSYAAAGLTTMADGTVYALMNAGRGLADLIRLPVGGEFPSLTPLEIPEGGVSGFARDESGTMYLASGAGHIRRLRPNGVLQTIFNAGLSVPLTPSGLALLPNGDLAIFDRDGHALLRLTTQCEGVAGPVARPGFSSDFTQGAYAPGQIVTLYGVGLGSDQGVIATADGNGFLPRSLGGLASLLMERRFPYCSRARTK